MRGHAAWYLLAHDVVVAGCWGAPQTPSRCPFGCIYQPACERSEQVGTSAERSLRSSTEQPGMTAGMPASQALWLPISQPPLDPAAYGSWDPLAQIINLL